ncbi:unnamed protein product [Ectocarpus sp. 12 AP-2014]
MVMFMISGVLLSEAGHAVSLDDRARVAETSLGLWVERRRWVAPYAGSLGSLFEGPLRGEALMRAPLELRNQAVKQAEGWAERLVAAIRSEAPVDDGGVEDGVAGNGDGGHGGAGGTVGAVTDSASATAGGVGPTSGVSGPVRPPGGKQVGAEHERAPQRGAVGHQEGRGRGGVVLEGDLWPSTRRRQGGLQALRTLSHHRLLFERLPGGALERKTQDGVQEEMTSASPLSHHQSSRLHTRRYRPSRLTNLRPN